MMSKEPETTSEATTKHVVVVGAGPAGLLATILLLRRNLKPASSASTTYRVTLVDPGVDYGKLDKDGLNRARSWMIGLSVHGLDAIRSVPDLYQHYVRGLGIDLTTLVIGFNKRFKRTITIKGFAPPDSSFIVDRNYICAALSRYVNDNFEEDEKFVSHYNTKALYVDGDNKNIIVRGESGDMTIGYDILLGCDGIRSIVRNAFLTRHRDFEFDLRGTFGKGKAVHVPLPPNIEDGTFFFLNEALPGCVSFTLPETGKKLNVNVGMSLNKEVAAELLSDDAKVVADYFRKNWHAFEIDADEAGKQWVDQGWNTISQVHCNFYHSEPLSALLLGDAAHATSPQIGQGMNTALADAAVLDNLLNENNDDWSTVLPKFSELRVKEGNALTDLSFYSFSLNGRQQLSLMFQENVRNVLHRFLPWLFEPYPMSMIPRGMKLSEAYNGMIKLGIIQKVRQTNDGIMRDHFEKSVGMVTCEEETKLWKKALVGGFHIAVVAGFSVALASFFKKEQ